MLLREVAYLIDSLNWPIYVVLRKNKCDIIGLGRTLVRPEGEFSCANEKLSLLDRQQKVSDFNVAGAPDLEEGFISNDQ